MRARKKAAGIQCTQAQVGLTAIGMGRTRQREPTGHGPAEMSCCPLDPGQPNVEALPTTPSTPLAKPSSKNGQRSKGGIALSCKVGMENQGGGRGGGRHNNPNRRVGRGSARGGPQPLARHDKRPRYDRARSKLQQPPSNPQTVCSILDNQRVSRASFPKVLQGSGHVSSRRGLAGIDPTVPRASASDGFQVLRRGVVEGVPQGGLVLQREIPPPRMAVLDAVATTPSIPRPSPKCLRCAATRSPDVSCSPLELEARVSSPGEGSAASCPSTDQPAR